MNFPSPPRFRGMTVLLCWLLLLPTVLGCAAVGMILPQASTPTPSITPTLTLTPTPTLTSTPTDIPAVCGGPPAMFILLVGSDARSNTYNAGLADAIRLVRVDFITPRIQLLAFPRDLYVEIPGIESHHGITHGKLNQAYLYGNPGYGYYDGPGQGPGLLSLTMEQNFGAGADRYIAMNLQAFRGIVDAVAGLEVELPYAIDGRVKKSTDPDFYFPAGYQHLDGYRTMLLARMRTLGDFQRTEIQNLILLAFAEKLLSPSVIPQLPGAVEAFRSSVQTDLGPAETAQLTCLAAMLDSQKVEFISFPESLFTVTRVQDPVLGYTSILSADFNVLRTYVQNFKSGALPEP